MNIVLKDRILDDDEFVYKLFKEFKIEELGAEEWTEQTQNQIINMQFHSHEQHYFTNQQKITDLIIVYRNEKVGRFIYFEKNDIIHIADILIAKKYRSKGIGRFLLNYMIIEAKKKGKRVQFFVNKTNRAIELYKRMGVTIIDENETEYLMEFLEKNFY